MESVPLSKVAPHLASTRYSRAQHVGLVDQSPGGGFSGRAAARFCACIFSIRRATCTGALILRRTTRSARRSRKRSCHDPGQGRRPREGHPNFIATASASFRSRDDPHPSIRYPFDTVDALTARWATEEPTFRLQTRGPTRSTLCETMKNASGGPVAQLLRRAGVAQKLTKRGAIGQETKTRRGVYRSRQRLRVLDPAACVRARRGSRD